MRITNTMMTNTTMPHASVVETSAVGGHRPTRDERLEKMDMAKMVLTNG